MDRCRIVVGSQCRLVYPTHTQTLSRCAMNVCMYVCIYVCIDWQGW